MWRFAPQTALPLIRIINLQIHTKMKNEQQNEHIQRVTIRYFDREITTAIIPEQDPEFYKALEEGDSLKAHLLHKPTWHKPYWMIESEMKLAQLEAEHKAELKRIEEMPPELLKIEMELRYGKPNAPNAKPRMLFGFIPIPLFF